MAIVTYNDNGTIKVVKFGNYVVSTDAVPVIRPEWVFIEGMTTSQVNNAGYTTYESKGLQDMGYSYQGCASPTALASVLTHNYSNPRLLPSGTRVAARMNHASGQDNCDTWAVFEVQEV